ncbi:lysozyme inhibitor LprI family protein [Dickeya solani]|uniref:Lysozyme inhibitor LprI N-terminal domain-containing protein n=1 Tax=Dickeya solani D s0432-1 TaxID=1231725 RepID=A0AAV3KGI3_9GAMM|nr:lysozyme inhibitor LprI family protein [Dickeya solani]ANE75821.1 hypothetical protein A4U42_11025 [Dickeya solani IPO 2222]AUH08768.1 hypothetical protein BJD21_10015 [Dickeya solani D s0432-1]AUH12756.1 hypothetical protein BJJ98_09980 [Dickeya solani]AYQ46243.1 hypothetical protein CTB91_00384 [Dickeya solani]AYQ50414.1 hypothetical protein DSOL99_00389 [Dickeya solani]
MRILFFVLLLFSFESYANDIQSCYEKKVTAYIQSCMEVLAQDENKKYNDEYDKFIKSIRSEDLANYSDFIESIANSKLFWDKYIASECRAEGLLNIKDSPAYHIAYSECLVKAYRIRVMFYKKYPF